MMMPSEDSTIPRAMRTQRIWILPVLAGVYFLAGKLGLQMAVVHPNATAVWAPTGIALAALLILGYGVWPAIFAGAFLVNLTTAGSLVTSLGIATGNTLEAVVGAFLVNRFAGGRDAFSRPADVFRFAALAALAATTLSATIGVTTLALAGDASWQSFDSIWFTWWLGDVSGAITVAPLLLVWIANPRGGWNREHVVESLLLLTILALTGWVVFGNSQHRSYPFMAIPALVWIAFRLGTRETATAVVLLAVLALVGTMQGLGPFGAAPPAQSLVVVQSFTGICALTALALAAAVAERSSIEGLLRKSEAEHRAIAALTSDFAILWRMELGSVLTPESVTDGFRDVTGYTLSELVERGGWPALVHRVDRRAVRRALAALSAGLEREVKGDVRIQTRAGEVRWLRVFTRQFPERDSSGASRLLTAAQDITDRKRSEEVLARHQAVIRALSTPVLRLSERLLILPVIGDVDVHRAQQLTRQLIEGIRKHRAKAVVIDLTGVAQFDAMAARHLVGAVDTTRLLGARAILSGVSAALAHRLVAGGIDLERLRTAGDLQAGVDEARRLLEPDLSRALPPAPPRAVPGVTRPSPTPGAADRR
jgi:anti-anti-sigma factor